jgi:hypothetical protein
MVRWHFVRDRRSLEVDWERVSREVLPPIQFHPVLHLLCHRLRAGVRHSLQHHPVPPLQEAASCTSPFASSTSIALLTPFVRAAQSSRREAQMRRFVPLPSAHDSFLTHRRAVRCPTRAHVLSEIQSFPCRLCSLGLMHSATRRLNVFVCSVSPPWESLRRKHCWSHWYDLRQRTLPPQKVATTAQWSKSWNHGEQNATLLSLFVMCSFPRN